MPKPIIIQNIESLQTNALLKNNTTPFTPDSDYEPATKKYIDDGLAGAGDSAILLNQTMDAGVTINCGVRYHNIYGKWVKTQNAQGIYIGNNTVVISGYVTLTTPVSTASNIYYLDASGNLTTTSTSVEAGFSLNTDGFYVDIEGAVVETIAYIEQTFTASDTVVVPTYATKADVFLVGGGAAGEYAGGAGGFAVTYTDISVTPEESISITVGAGGTTSSRAGNYSEFASASYRANGGGAPSGSGGLQTGGSGGSGGGGYDNQGTTPGAGGTNGGNGGTAVGYPSQGGAGGTGQGTTTRAFGDPSGLLCSGGGGGGNYYGGGGSAGAGGGGAGGGYGGAGQAGSAGLGGGGGGSYYTSQSGVGGSGRVIVRWKQ